MTVRIITGIDGNPVFVTSGDSYIQGIGNISGSSSVGISTTANDRSLINITNTDNDEELDVEILNDSLDLSMSGDNLNVDMGDGNNNISLDTNNSVIRSNGGNDSITVHGNDNFIDSGDGNDSIKWWGSENIIRGGNGNDYIATDLSLMDAEDGYDISRTVYQKTKTATRIYSEQKTRREGNATNGIYEIVENVYYEVACEYGVNKIYAKPKGNNDVDGGNGSDNIKFGTQLVSTSAEFIDHDTGTPVKTGKVEFVSRTMVQAPAPPTPPTPPTPPAPSAPTTTYSTSTYNASNGSGFNNTGFTGGGYSGYSSYSSSGSRSGASTGFTGR